MKTPLILFISFFFAFYPPIDHVLKKLLQQINESRLLYPQEKVYVHTDKTVYAQNETLWFKAYLAEGIEHQKDTLSRILYIDFIRDEDSSVVLKKIMPIVDSQSNGHIEITPALNEGNYTLRAYTNWMKNFGSEYFFYMPIKVIHNPNKTNLHTTEKAKVDLLFFPEGGHLLEGINNWMGIQAINKTAKNGMASKVEILENDKQIAIIETSKDGIGAFNLYIKPNCLYTARCLDIDNEKSTFSLPKPSKHSIGLHVDNSSQIDIKTHIFLTMPEKDKPNKLFVIGHLRGKPYFATTIDISDKSLSELLITIPKKNFTQEGVATITLFDQDGFPLAERLVYVDFVSNKIMINVTANSSNKPKEKISLEIEAKNAENQPIEGVFSFSALAAMDEQSYWQGTDLYSYMLLGSELKMPLHHLSAYFSAKNKSNAQQIDNLLLTQGWTKFEWHKNKTITYPTEQFLSLAGNISDKTNKPVLNENILVSIKDATNNALSQYVSTNEKGNFELNGLEYSDSTNVYVRFMDKKCNKCTLKILHPLDSLHLPYLPTMENIPIQTLDYLENYQKQTQQKEITLEEVAVRGTKIDKSPIKMDGRRMYKEAEMVFHIKQEETINKKNVLEYLQGKNAININGLSPLSGAGDKLVNTSSTRGRSSFLGSNEVLFLLDGTPTDIQTIMSISIVQVETIEVIKSAKAGLLFGARATNGMVNVLTQTYKNRPIPTVEDFKNSLVAQTQGYSLVKIFHVPNYEKEKTDKLDYRTTLHWQPTFTTDKNGKATLTFYNNDLQTPIFIKINGTDFQGNFGGYEGFIGK